MASGFLILKSQKHIKGETMGRKPKRSSWGSVTQYKPNVWRLRYPAAPDPITGKRRQGSETVYGSKADATKRLAELQLLYDSKRSSKVLTVDKCWELYYRPYIKRLAPSTVAGYESKYAKHIKPAFGRMGMESIKKAQVQAWLDGMTYGQARSCRAVLRALYSFANDNDLIDSNLMSKRYALPKKPKTEANPSDTVHNEETLLRLLAAAKGEYWEAAFILSAFGGARREEAVGAKWEHVSFIDNCAIVEFRDSVQYINGEVVICELKTEGSYRTAIIEGKPAARLKELFFERIGDTWVTEGDNCSPVNPDALSAAYKRWHIGKPFQYVPWKYLRNSYATNLHARGVELGIISKLLGHTTPTITYKHYDRMSAQQLIDVLKK